MFKTKATRSTKKNTSGSAFYPEGSTGSVQRISYPSPFRPVPVPKPVIQRAIDNQLLAGYSKRKDHAGVIAKLINAYNQDIRSKERHDLINALLPIQTEVYKWFDNHREKDLDENPEAVKMKKVLNELQREHESLVRQSVINKDDTPPIAGFGTLPEKMQTRIRNLWSDLLNNTGNIQISEDLPYDRGKKKEHQEGFRYTALAAFARILQTEFGRELLFRANADTNGKKLITIRPGISENRGEILKEDFEASGTDPDNGELAEVDLKQLFRNKKKGSKSWNKTKKQLKAFPELIIPGDSTTAARIQLIHNAPKTFAGHPGYKIKIDGAFHYFKFNTGTSSEVVLTPDTFDSSRYPTSRFIDSEGNEIIVPAFVTLTHELGHAVHMLEGNAVGNVSPTLGKAVVPGENFTSWSNLEEYNTINGVENKIRGEAGLTPRFGHGNFYLPFIKEFKDGPIKDLLKLTDKMPENIQKHAQDGINETYDALNTKYDLSLARKIMRKTKKDVEKLILEYEKSRQPVQQPAQQLPVIRRSRGILPFLKIFPFG